MYKYKLNLQERDESRSAYQEKRIAAFQDIEKRLNMTWLLVLTKNPLSCAQHSMNRCLGWPPCTENLRMSTHHLRS